ncbi:hypothetical protein LCGC14_2190200, partial [marine sediment metagenome]
MFQRRIGGGGEVDRRDGVEVATDGRVAQRGPVVDVQRHA